MSAAPIAIPEKLQTSVKSARATSRERFQKPVVIALEISALASVSYGCFLAYRPLGLIVPGAYILALGLLADLRGSGRGDRAGILQTSSKTGGEGRA